MQSISIHKPEGVAYFERGGKLIRNEQETEITVKDITYRFGVVRIKLSDKTQLVFKRFPVSYSKKYV